MLESVPVRNRKSPFILNETVSKELLEKTQ